MTIRSTKLRTIWIAVAISIVLSIFFVTPALAAEEKTTDVAVSFTAGTLTLNKAPNIDFGDQSIASSEISAQNVSSPVQVSDARGSGSGYKLMVELSPFTKAGDATLQGAKLVFNNAKIEAAEGTVAQPPTADSSIEIVSDNSSTPFLTAESGTGQGVWNASFANADVLLDVLPGTQQPGAAEATLNWSLEDTV